MYILIFYEKFNRSDRLFKTDCMNYSKLFTGLKYFGLRRGGGGRIAKCRCSALNVEHRAGASDGGAYRQVPVFSAECRASGGGRQPPPKPGVQR